MTWIPSIARLGILRRLGPHSPLPHLKRLVCSMEMNDKVIDFPTYRGNLIMGNNVAEIKEYLIVQFMNIFG